MSSSPPVVEDPLQDPSYSYVPPSPSPSPSPDKQEVEEEEKEAVRRLPDSVRVLQYNSVDGHTLYTISIIWDQHSHWTVSKRFSDIDILHQALANKVDNIPNLPPKKILFNKEVEFLNKRKAEIEEYLVAMFNIPHITIFPEVQAFFKMNERGVRIKPLGNSVPAVVCKFKDPQFGFNSVWFDQKLGVGVSISENGNALSRVDKVILNVKLPWEVKSNLSILFV
jgi:hypothetical protein